MKKFLTFIILSLLAASAVQAKQLNDKLLNRPYADMKAWHLGFSIGLHMQDLQLTNNGLSEDGAQWFAEQPAFSPGFCVNGLIDFRLHTHFNVRLSPGIWFGNKILEFRDAIGGSVQRQNLKSTLLVLPIDLKFSSLRYRNIRPYLTAGVMPAFDVGKRRSDEIIHLKKFDTFLTIGLGIDTYFPYFKFIPEVKFCFGLGNTLNKNRSDLADTPGQMIYTKSIDRAVSRMVVLTFYFE